MLNKINERYENFEIRSVDLYLLRRLEDLANEVAIRSFLRELRFKYLFRFLMTKKLFVISELYFTIDKNERIVEYEVGRIYEPFPSNTFFSSHELYLKFDKSIYSAKTPRINSIRINPMDIVETENLLKEFIWKSKLDYYYYLEYHRYFVFPLDAKVIHYSMVL